MLANVAGKCGLLEVCRECPIKLRLTALPYAFGSSKGERWIGCVEGEGE